MQAFPRTHHVLSEPATKSHKNQHRGRGQLKVDRDRSLYGANEINQLPLSAVDYGIRFQMELENANLHAPAAENVKQRCKEYLLEFAKQMKQRLPTNMQQLQSLGALSPSTVLSVQKKPQLASLSFLHLYTGNLGKLDQQWRVLDTLQWENTEDCKTEQF